ncbi:MAG: hypothetical protein ABI406_20325 [Ktedonobacteraceae bacterium]
MIDTLMAIWNRGYGGRGILVSLAFLLICISISLLLVTVGNSWSALWFHQVPDATRSDTLGATLTATAQTPIKVATPGGTSIVYAPTITPTTNPCLLTATTGKASHAVASTTAQLGTGGGYTATPTSVPHPRPTATATPHPLPTSTPVPLPTPTAITTATSTPVPTPTPTLTPTPLPSPTATATSTATPTPTPSPTATATSTPTGTPTTVPTVMPSVAVTPSVPAHLRGGTPVATPTATAVHGQNKTVGGTNCSSIYSGSGDSVGLTLDGSIGAILVRNLWIILGGSTLGTLLFYITIYLLNRKRIMQQEAKITNSEAEK